VSFVAARPSHDRQLVWCCIDKYGRRHGVVTRHQKKRSFSEQASSAHTDAMILAPQGVTTILPCIRGCRLQE
jgi:hypothetical protein